MERRVVITGIGLVSALGIGTDATWSALLAGTSGVGRVTKFDVTNFTLILSDGAEDHEVGAD